MILILLIPEEKFTDDMWEDEDFDPNDVGVVVASALAGDDMLGGRVEAVGRHDDEIVFVRQREGTGGRGSSEAGRTGDGEGRLVPRSGMTACV